MRNFNPGIYQKYLPTENENSMSHSHCVFNSRLNLTENSIPYRKTLSNFMYQYTKLSIFGI
jgi:hypothetical protein